MDIDFLAELGELDKPTQAELGYDTTYTTHSLSEDLDDSEDSMFPYPNASTYLYGIGHWLEDDSITGSTWTAWQDSNLRLQHDFTLSSASVKKKPHVEEAMNRFQTSFYGVRAPKYHTVHKQLFLMEEMRIGSEFNVHSSKRILAKIFFSVHQRTLAGMLFMCTNSIMKMMIFLKS
jgi:hypothetical protein